MGSILQERVAQRCVERLCIGDREWKKKAPRSTSRPNVAGWVPDIIIVIGDAEQQQEAEEGDCCLSAPVAKPERFWMLEENHG